MSKKKNLPVQSEEEIKTQDLLKQVRNVTLIFGLLFSVLGVLLLLFPDETGGFLWLIFGIGALGFGIYRMIRYFTVQVYQTVIATELFFGILFVVFGILALVQRGSILENLMFILGIMVLGGSVLKLQTSINLAQVGYTRWWLIMVLGLIASVLGLLMIVEPDIIKNNKQILMGAFLIYDGISAILSAIVLSIIRRRLRRGQLASKRPAEEAEAPSEAPASFQADRPEPASFDSWHQGQAAPPVPPVPPAAEPAFNAIDADFKEVPDPMAQEDPFAVQNGNNASKFDAETGEPVVKKPRFDPDTGKPLYPEEEN